MVGTQHELLLSSVLVQGSLVLSLFHGVSRNSCPAWNPSYLKTLLVLFQNLDLRLVRLLCFGGDILFNNVSLTHKIWGNNLQSRLPLRSPWPELGIAGLEI